MQIAAATPATGTNRRWPTPLALVVLPFTDTLVFVAGECGVHPPQLIQSGTTEPALRLLKLGAVTFRGIRP